MHRLVGVNSAVMLAAFSLGLLAAAGPVRAARVLVPEGTIFYAELGETVTSNSDKYPVGYQPLGHVWRDVVIGGIVVIEAGTPIELRVTNLSPRGMGGRGAGIEISAMYVATVGGEEIAVRGGYGQEAVDSSGLNAVIGMAGSWALPGVGGFLGLIIPGRKAELEEGMIFDIEVPADTYLNVPDEALPKLSLRPPTGMTVSVLNDEMSAASLQLPLAIRLCGHDWTDEITVDAVNDEKIRPIPAVMLSLRSENNCFAARVSVELEPLVEHFRHGINRFDLTLGEVTEEVVLNIEF